MSCPGIDEERAAVLETVDFVSPRLAGFHANQRPRAARGEFPGKGFVSIEAVRHDSFSGCRGQDLISQANEAARGDAEFEVLQIAFGLHDLKQALAHHDQFGGLARRGFGDVNHQVLKRLVGGAINFFEKNLGLADLEFVAFATHGLNEDAQVKDASSVDVPAVFAVGRFHAQSQGFSGVRRPTSRGCDGW